MERVKILMFGGKGWIGTHLCKLIDADSTIDLFHAQSRADDDEAVEQEIIQINPDRIVSLIGRTSGPGFSTIDYLEQKGKLVENVRDNLYGPLVLATLSKKYNIHFTYLGTGCIFNGYPEIGYIESDKPDFFGSSYSTVKGFTDKIMHMFEDNVLNLRIRMPITAEKHPKNFITKITTYQKICNMPNSMSVLPDLLPCMLDMVKNKITGTVNFTNPGIVSHNEILEMYREIVDKNFVWENFTIDEQKCILAGERSNDFLNTARLTMLYPNILPIKESIRKILHQLKI